MENIKLQYPINGSSALDVTAGQHEETRIIDFPQVRRRPLHAKPSDFDAWCSDGAEASAERAGAAKGSRFVDALRHGTCAGAPVGKMTSGQAAAVCIGFFLVSMASLLLL